MSATHKVSPALASAIPPVRSRNYAEVPAEEPTARAWRVLHACQGVRDLLPVVEGQLACGIRPYLTNSSGEFDAALLLQPGAQEKTSPVSLMTAWNEVRNWRRCLLEAGADQGGPVFDLVHAHSFPAGMAAVRSCPAVVYDLRTFVEQHAPCATEASGRGNENSWLARSFRVAEQFVLARAGAVVVHSGRLHAGVLERGAASENVFQIPDPLSPEIIEDLRQPLALQAASAPPELSEPDCINFFAAGMVAGSATKQQDTGLSGEVIRLLEMLVLLRTDVPEARLFLPAAGNIEIVELLEKSTALGIADAVHAVPLTDCERVLAAADVIIAGPEPPPCSSQYDPDSERPSELECYKNDGPTEVPNCSAEGSAVAANRVSSTRADAGVGQPPSVAHFVANSALRAMVVGCPLLAADCPENRDVSPNGRGLIWYCADDVRDLACRAAFLARNPDLRRSLADNARKHLIETRRPEAVGRQYCAVYRHAFARRKTSGAAPATGVRLQPLVACL